MDISPIKSVEYLEEILKELLPRLYGANHVLQGDTEERLGLADQGGSALLRERIIATLQEMEPAPEVPRSSGAWRLYSILALRYLRNLTQRAVAEELGLSVRQLAREQSRAIHQLTCRLWEETDHGRDWTLPGKSDRIHALTHFDLEGVHSDEWRLQVARELTSLQSHSAGTRTDVSEVLRQIATTMSGPLSEQGVTVSVGRVAPDTASVAHPSVVRQIVVGTMTHLARQMTTGRLELTSTKSETHVSFAILGTPIPDPHAVQKPFLSDLVDLAGGQIDSYPEADGLCVCISLPLVEDVIVLVIDDNEDLQRFYEGCVAGTRFLIVGIGEGRRVFETIQSVRPAILVLDVMLPDIDGWDLLAQVHEHPLSRHIPVVVCSVVREEELALALGAQVCLAKPVRRHQFLEALERVASRVV